MKEPTVGDARPLRPTLRRLCLGLPVLYFCTGFLQPYRDAEINGLLARNILAGRGLLLPRDTIPDCFHWELHAHGQSVAVDVKAIDATVQRLIDDGRLTPGEPDYLVQPTRRPDRWASSFLPGPALWGLPFFAVGQLTLGRWAESWLFFALCCKLAAAVAAAGSAALLYAVLMRRFDAATANGVIVCYALATCVWSVASQLLMSHAPNLLLLTAAQYAYDRAATDRRWAAAVGVCLGLAVWCRPTSALVVAAVALWWLWRDWRRGLTMIAAGLPLVVLLLAHNQYLFGAPWHFGELAQADSIGQIRGGGAVFQTPLWEGLPGLLVSPSRGLFVYSPVLLFAVWGLATGLRGPHALWLWPWVIGMLAVWIVQALHFDWWGGYAYGYRPIVDTVPVLCLGLAEVYRRVMDSVRGRFWYRALFVWSLGAQLVGVLLYDLIGWNSRQAWEVTRADGTVERRLAWDDTLAQGQAVAQPVRMNIDDPRYRHRLWNIIDSPLVYHLSHPLDSLTTRLQLSAYTALAGRFKLAETLDSLGMGFAALGRPEQGLPLVEQALQLDPDNAERRRHFATFRSPR